MVGVLGPDDVSLTFDATLGEVRRHCGGHSEVVGSEIFGVLEAEMARDAGDPNVHWVGYFGYSARTDLPAKPWGRGPDAVWMRCTQLISPTRRDSSESSGWKACTRLRPFSLAE